MELARTEREYQKALHAGESTCFTSCRWLASWHLEKMSYSEARKYLGHACFMQPKEVSVWIALSICCALGRDFSEGQIAIQEATRLLDRPLDDIRVRYCRALLLEKQGSVRQAIHAYTDLLDMCITGAPAVVGLVRSLDIDKSAGAEAEMTLGARAGLGRANGASSATDAAMNTILVRTQIKALIARHKDMRKTSARTQRPQGRGQGLGKRGRGRVGGRGEGREEEEEEQEEGLTVPIVTSADKIAETLINIMISAFKKRENGRDPTNNEMEDLLAELTEERIEEMLSSNAPGTGADAGAGAGAGPTAGTGSSSGTSSGSGSAANPLTIATAASLRAVAGGTENVHMTQPGSSSSSSSSNSASSRGLDPSGSVSLQEMLYETHLRIACCYRQLGDNESCRIICQYELIDAIARDRAAANAKSGGGSNPRPMHADADTTGTAYILAHAHCMLGLLHEDARRYPDAELAYRQVLCAVPGYFLGLIRLSLIYLRYKETIPQALNCLGKAVELNPSSAYAWYLLGRCYMSSAQYPDAKECYARCINLDPNNEDCWCSIGILFYAYGQYREALGFFSRALRLNHTMCEAWYNVGALYDICGQKNEAEDAYAKSRKYGLSPRLGRSGLSLDLSDVTSRKKRKKKSHEIGASLAAYHGDSAVTHTRAPSRKVIAAPVPVPVPAPAPAPPAAAIDTDTGTGTNMNGYNNYYAGGDGEGEREREVMTFEGSFMPMGLSHMSHMGEGAGGVGASQMGDGESSLMVDGIGNSQF